MDLNDYQDGALLTVIYPRKYAVIYPALKLAGEAGEVAEKIGKVLRDKTEDHYQTDEFREDLKKELGDVLWYIAALAQDLNLTLDEIGAYNLWKLTNRMARGVLQGSGDDR